LTQGRIGRRDNRVAMRIERPLSPTTKKTLRELK